jgi:hypothetical protein
MGRALTVVAVVGMLFGWWGVVRPTPACAGPLSASERVSRSKAFFESGLAHYNLDEYAAALTAFEEGYRLKPLPLFLFNIAQAHRKLGNTAKAIEFYRRFLTQDPNSPLRAETLGYLKDLEHPTTPPPATAPTIAPTPPEAAPLAPAEPAPAPVAKPVEQVEPPPPVIAATRSDAPPHRRRWLWGVVGGSIAVVVVAGVAVGVGVGLTHRGPPPESLLGNYPVTLK